MQIEQVVHQRLEAYYQQDRERADEPDEVVKPNVRFTGKNFEVGGNKALAATAIGYIRMVLFAFLFAGDMIFNQLGGVDSFPAPIKDSYKWMQENKF